MSRNKKVNTSKFLQTLFPKRKNKFGGDANEPSNIEVMQEPRKIMGEDGEEYYQPIRFTRSLPFTGLDPYSGHHTSNVSITNEGKAVSAGLMRDPKYNYMKQSTALDENGQPVTAYYKPPVMNPDGTVDSNDPTSLPEITVPPRDPFSQSYIDEINANLEGPVGRPWDTQETHGGIGQLFGQISHYIPFKKELRGLFEDWGMTPEEANSIRVAIENGLFYNPRAKNLLALAAGAGGGLMNPKTAPYSLLSILGGSIAYPAIVNAMNDFPLWLGKDYDSSEWLADKAYDLGIRDSYFTSPEPYRAIMGLGAAFVPGSGYSNAYRAAGWNPGNMQTIMGIGESMEEGINYGGNWALGHWIPQYKDLDSVAPEDAARQDSINTRAKNMGFFSLSDSPIQRLFDTSYNRRNAKANQIDSLYQNGVISQEQAIKDSPIYQKGDRDRLLKAITATKLLQRAVDLENAKRGYPIDDPTFMDYPQVINQGHLNMINTPDSPMDQDSKNTLQAYYLYGRELDKIQKEFDKVVEEGDMNRASELREKFNEICDLLNSGPIYMSK